MGLQKAMTFAWPQLLWLLAVPAGLLAWELLRRRGPGSDAHPKILRAEAGLRSVNLVGESSPRAASSRRRVLLCAGAALSVVALARPQWGRLEEPVFDQSREIIIALDLSRSMLSPDVKPSRLERSKLLIQSLLDSLSGERVGLVVFSGTAFLQAPMSADYEIIREFLPSLGPDFLPEGGTNYSQLIDTSLDAFGEGSSADRYLIILSDGGATDDDWKGKVDALAKRGIRVIGLGVGTAAGTMIPDGQGGFMKDDSGAVVMSKLESGTLRDLSSATHGVYVDASTWVDLPKVLASTVEQGRKGRFVERNTVRYAERFQWALAPALLCLIASFWLEFPVVPKSREVRLGGPPTGARRSKQALAAAAAAAALLVAAARPAPGQGAPDPAASLSKVVGRLSSQAQCSSLDWAEFGGDTVTWGQHLQSGGQQVPERPVRDALAAVDIGSRSDPKAADWDKLRSELEALLRKQDDQKKQDQKKDQQQDQQQDQKQDQKEDQKRDQQQNQKQQQSAQDSGKQEKPQDSGGQPPGQQGPRQQKAFGDMGAPTPEPQGQEPPGGMQKVGGARKDQANDPARNDPGLAIPLEKLEQVKNQDSPSELFDMLRRSEPMPTPANKGPNW
jgi:Ca-activated chloride channel family protein